MDVVSFAGYTVTVGAVASAIVEILKRLPRVPVWAGEPLKLRILVAIVCAVLSVGAGVINGDSISATVVVQSIMSYMAAAATYDHLFKN